MIKLSPSGSLRLRFLQSVTLWTILCVAAIWVSAIGIFSHHVEESYHEELEVHVRELAHLTELTKDGRLRLTRPLSDPRYEEPLSGFYWQITADGHPPLMSSSMTRGRLDEEIAHSSQILHRSQNGPTGPAITYGFMRKGPGGEDIHFVIATDQSELNRLIDNFTRDLTFLLAGLSILMLVTGYAVISFGLRPLGRLSREIGRLRRGEAPELEGDFPAEIAPLAMDLNAYIRQNDAMISRARVQAGNLAHSLRTPLAIITDEAERMAKEGRASDSAEVMLDQAYAMGKQISYQLARIRSSAGKPPPDRQVVLPDVALPILRAMKRLHPTKTFSIETDGCEGVNVPVDAIDFTELLSILLDNAGKWAQRSVTLTFICGDNGTARACVRDDGPGMSDEQIEKAFDLGTRFDATVPGSGLGLAIAKDLADAMGMELRLKRLPKGLEATATFETRPPS